MEKLRILQRKLGGVILAAVFLYFGLPGYVLPFSVWDWYPGLAGTYAFAVHLRLGIAHDGDRWPPAAAGRSDLDGEYLCVF